MLLLRCRFCRAFLVLHLPLCRLEFLPFLVNQPPYIRIIPAFPASAPNDHLNSERLMAATEEFMSDCEHVVVPAIACSNARRIAKAAHATTAGASISMRSKASS